MVGYIGLIVCSMIRLEDHNDDVAEDNTQSAVNIEKLTLILGEVKNDFQNYSAYVVEKTFKTVVMSYFLIY